MNEMSFLTDLLLSGASSAFAGDVGAADRFSTSGWDLPP